MRITSLCLLAALLACTEPLSPPTLEVPSYRSTVLRDNVRFPFETSVLSCSGEVIDVVGYHQFMIHQLINEEGVEKQFVIHERTAGTGRSQTTGAKYEFRDRFLIVGQSQGVGQGGASFTSHQTLHLIAQGSLDDRVLVQQTVHIVLTGNGIERVTRETEFDQCRG